MARINYAPQPLDVVYAGTEDINNPGVRVPATFRYHSMMFKFKPVLPTEDVEQAGNLYDVDESAAKGHTEVDISGKASVQDMIAYLSTQYCLPVFAAVSGSVHSATFAGKSLEGNLRNTQTLEYGQAGTGGANIVTNFGGQDCEIDFAPGKSAQLKGKGMGHFRLAGQDLTPGVTQLGRSILSPRRVDVYIATSEAGLGAGILAPPFAPLTTKFKHNKTQDTVESLNSSIDSFDAFVEDKPDPEYDLVFARNSASDAYIDSIVTNTLYYLMLVSRGKLIEGGLYDQIVFSSPVMFKNPGQGSDQKVMTNTLTARMIHDDAFNAVGGALKIEAQSTMASL